MNRHAQEQQIAADLDLISLIEIAGDRNARRAAKAQRKAINAQIKAWNVEDGLSAMSDADLLAELMA